MQALLGLTVSDPLAMGEVWRLASPLLDLTANLTRGCWGMGHVREGAPLVRRAKIHGPVDLAAALSDAGSHQLLAIAEDEPRACPHAEVVQPLRYRGWLFAVGGAVPGPAGDDRLRRAAEILGRATPPPRTLAEALSLGAVEALTRARTLDRRVTRPELLGATVCDGFERVAQALPDTPLAALALVRGAVFGWSRGRPLFVWRGARSWGGRARRRTVRATVVTDRVPSQGAAVEEQMTSGGLVVTEDGAWRVLGG